MIKFAICDDEPVMVQEISNLLSLYMDGQTITSYSVASFSNGCALLESGCNFDIIFLDIQMDDLDGIYVFFPAGYRYWNRTAYVVWAKPFYSG